MLASPNRSSDLPLVSIIMPAFNASRYLETSLKSVLTQLYKNWELLVVDDASTDDTLEIVAKFAKHDDRIIVYHQEVNDGVAKARNKGIENARGKYIAFLDTDDVWRGDKLSKQVDLMETTGSLICYSRYRRIDENNSVLGTVNPPLEVDYRAMLRSNFIGNLTGIYNAEILGKEYLTDYGHEDYVAWLELLKKTAKAICLDEKLADYRVSRGSVSSNKLRTVSWQWKIYRGSQGLGVVYSSWLMFCYGYHALHKRAT